MERLALAPPLFIFHIQIIIIQACAKGNCPYEAESVEILSHNQVALRKLQAPIGVNLHTRDK